MLKTIFWNFLKRILEDRGLSLYVPGGPKLASAAEEGWRTVIKRSRSGTRTPALRSWTSVTSRMRRAGRSGTGPSMEDRSRDTYFTVSSSSLLPPIKERTMLNFVHCTKNAGLPVEYVQYYRLLVDDFASNS